MVSPADSSDLSLEEWRCLQDAASGRPLQDYSTPTLARLERLGLLMRGWSHFYVLTARGEHALTQKAPGGPAPRD